MKPKHIIQIGLLIIAIGALFMIGLMFVEKIDRLPEEENCEMRYEYKK